MRISLLVTLMLWGGNVFAQDMFHVFPRFSDGRLSGGDSWRSTLSILPWFDSDAPQCSLNLYGMTTSFPGTSANSVFTINIPAGGFLSIRSMGLQTLQNGYATLTCNKYVYASVQFAYYNGVGTKLGEATVPSVTFESFESRMVFDMTEGALFGFAVANNTDISHTYDVTLTGSFGTRTGSFNLGPRSANGMFVSDLITNIPAGATGIMRIRSRDYSDHSAMGLRFTGGVFTTIPSD